MSDIFDRLIAADTRNQLLAKLLEAKALNVRTCGSCEHWMKSSACPREKGVGTGPTSGDPPCDRFRLATARSRETSDSPIDKS